MPGEIVAESGWDEAGNRIAALALASQLAQEFLFVHAVLEGFAAIDEDDWDFVVELAAQVGVGVDVDFMPSEAAAARKLGQTLFHYFAQMTSLAGIDHDIARLRHAERF
jgi:hypothetical protein